MKLSIKKLKYYMELNEVTPQDIAEALEITRMSIYHYLHGRRNPTPLVIHQLAEFLDTSTEELYYE